MFYHKVFEHGFSFIIYKPAKVCKNIPTIIDNILTNYVFDHNLKIIFKSETSDHFPIGFTIQCGKNKSKFQTLVYHKMYFKIYLFSIDNM